MRRFFKSTTVFLLPIIVSLVSAEFLLRKIPNDYLYKKHYLDNNSEQIKVLFLGSSQVFYDIDPQFISFKSFNAAYISQTLKYDLAILKKYENKWTRLSCVVIPVDYFSLSTQLESSPEAWRIKNYNIYYGMYSSYNIADYTEIFSNQFLINVSRLFSFYYKHMQTLSSSLSGWGTKYKYMDRQDLTLSGQIAAKRHTYSIPYRKENIEDLKSIINFATEKRLKVILVTSPAYKTYVAHLNNTQLFYATNMADSIAVANPNVVYANLLNDPAFVADDFYDADHLNDKGAKKMSRKMDSLISLSLFKNE